VAGLGELPVSAGTGVGTRAKAGAARRPSRHRNGGHCRLGGWPPWSWADGLGVLRRVGRLAIRDVGAHFSVTVRMNPQVRAAPPGLPWDLGHQGQNTTGGLW